MTGKFGGAANAIGGGQQPIGRRSTIVDDVDFFNYS